MPTDDRNSSPNTQKNVSQFKQFISSNKDYLEQKYHQHFINSRPQSQQKIKLSLLPVQNLISYLYQIFSLQKYQKDKKINDAIQNSVEQNVKEYLFELDPVKLSQQNELTFQKFLQILIYIIGKNQIFAVQYDSKTINNAQNSPKSNKGTKDINLHVNVSIQNIQNEEHVIQDGQFIHNNSSTYIQKNSKIISALGLENQFQFQNHSQTNNNQLNPQKLIKKNTKALFDFYCRQQMQLGGVITFDRLSQQTFSMSLGKCLTFAKAMNLFNAFIKRQDLVSKFKKVSQGKKYIDYQKFEAMLGEFQVMDPNFNQRVGLLSEDIRKVLRYVKLPFNTKDTNPRENIAVRNFSSKLTDHSGHSSQQLKIQINQKRHQLVNTKRLKQIKEYMMWKQSRPELINQRDLLGGKTSKQKDLTVELSFIGSIIHPEEQDQTYLKDHMIPKLQKQTEKISKFGKIFQTQRYKSMDKLTLRKLSVVSDMKKRIQQIQSSQNLQMMKKMDRSFIPPKNRYSHK